MMAGAFLYLPEKYQSKGVHKRLLTDVAVLNGEYRRGKHQLWAWPYGVNRPVIDAGVGDCQTAGNKKGSLAPLGYDLLLVLLHQAIWLNHPGYTLVAKETAST